jgi:hypothetical protein
MVVPLPVRTLRQGRTGDGVTKGWLLGEAIEFRSREGPNLPDIDSHQRSEARPPTNPPSPP